MIIYNNKEIVFDYNETLSIYEIVKNHIKLMPKEYREKYSNCEIVSQLLNRDVECGITICEELEVEPHSKEWFCKYDNENNFELSGKQHENFMNLISDDSSHEFMSFMQDTFLNLFEEYEKTSGKKRVCKNIRDLTFEELRKNISFIPSDTLIELSRNPCEEEWNKIKKDLDKEVMIFIKGEIE